VLLIELLIKKLFVCVFQTNFQLFKLNYFSLKSIRSCTVFFNVAVVAVVFSPARREYNFNLSPLSRKYTLIQTFASPNSLKIERKMQSVNKIVIHFKKTSGLASRYYYNTYRHSPNSNLPIIILKKTSDGTTGWIIIMYEHLCHVFTAFSVCIYILCSSVKVDELASLGGNFRDYLSPGALVYPVSVPCLCYVFFDLPHYS